MSATLTKSLHTVTAVSRVALHLMPKAKRRPQPGREEFVHHYVDEALIVLGYKPVDFHVNDPTIVAARQAVLKVLP